MLFSEWEVSQVLVIGMEGRKRGWAVLQHKWSSLPLMQHIMVGKGKLFSTWILVICCSVVPRSVSKTREVNSPIRCLKGCCLLHNR